MPVARLLLSRRPRSFEGGHVIINILNLKDKNTQHNIYSYARK